MKNPLVDALRQAQGDVQADASESASTADNLHLPSGRADSGAAPIHSDSLSDAETLTEEVAPEDVANGELASNDLDLLATGRYRQEKSAQIEEIADDAVANASEVAQPMSDDVLVAAAEQLDEIQSLALEPPNGEHQILSATAMLNAQGANLDRGIPFVQKVGRLTPIICLVALSAAAAGYYRWNQVAALSLNNDLDGMAQITSASLVNFDRTSAGQQLPTSGQSLFTIKSALAGTAASGRSIATMPSAIGAEIDATNVKRAAQSIASPAVPVLTDAGQQTRSAIAEESAVNDKAHALVKKGYGAYQAQDLEQAEMHYNDALAIEPNHADALVGIAAIYSQTNRTANALVAYERLLSVDPNNANAISGILTIHANEFDSDSESELKYLIQQYPNADPLHYALGSVFVGQSRWPDAKQAFLAAHEIAPNNANYSYNVAVSMENIGQYDGARSYYEAALLSVGTDSSFDRQAVEARLRTLSIGSKERL